MRSPEHCRCRAIVPRSIAPRAGAEVERCVRCELARLAQTYRLLAWNAVLFSTSPLGIRLPEHL